MHHNTTQDDPSTYLICQNTIDPIAMQLDEPIQTFQLITMHLTMRCENRWLSIQTNHSSLGLRGLEHLFIFFGFSQTATLATRSTFLLPFVLRCNRACNNRKKGGKCISETCVCVVVKNFLVISTYLPKSAQTLRIGPTSTGVVLPPRLSLR